MTMIPHGYKSSEVGIIPANWKVSTLGEGNARFTKGYGISKADLSEGGIPCVRYAELYTTYGDMSVLSTPASTTLPERARKFAHKGDVIFACSGETFEDIGRALAYIGASPIAVGGDTLIYSNHNFEPSFLGYLLNSRYVVRQKMANSVGTTIVHIREKQLAELVVAYPEYEEQRAIATALADVDALIEAKRALLEKKRAIKQGAMQELLTGKRRLPGFPVTPMKHTEIGDLPEDWEVSITKKCLSMPITDGPHETPTLCDDGIPFISAESVSSGNGRIDFSRMRGYISEAYHQECCKKYKPQVNDVYIIKSGSTTGKVAIVKTSQVFNIWSPLAVLRARQSIDPDFLFYSVQSNYYQEQIIQAWGMGTQQNIGMRTLERLKIAYPEYAEQRAIATALSDIDEEIEGLEHELSKLCNLKQGMMQNLLTGRIRLV